MKIVLVGADGQLGTDIYKYFKEKKSDIVGLTIDDIEVCDKNSCSSVLFKLKPDLVINTAAFNLVDACEDEIARAFEVNASGVKNIAEICSSLNAVMVHFSTDYVFGGYEKNTPYTEDDCPAPLSIYGLSKLAGEYIIRYILKKYYLVRISGLYGHKSCLGKGYNFVEFMIDLAKQGRDIRVVEDQILTPTSTKDVTEKLYELINTEKYGLYHMTNTGSCSWYDFTREIFRLTGQNPKIIPITTGTFDAKAKRPYYSVLDNKNLRLAGLKDLRDWKEALAGYIKERTTLKKQ